jgi:hypothetical protein
MATSVVGGRTGTIGAPVTMPAASGGGGGTTPGATTATNLGTGALGYTYDSKGRLLFEGYPTPFQKGDKVRGDGNPANYSDAGNGPLPDVVYSRWVAAGAPDATKFPPGQGGRTGAPALPLELGGGGGAGVGGSTVGSSLGGAGGTGRSLIDDPAIKKAWQQYLDGIDDGKALKALLGLDPTAPLPTNINTTLSAPLVGNLDAPGQVQTRNVDTIAAPQLGGPATAEATTVESTDTAALRQIAGGGGPLADQLRAQNALAAMEATQRANSLANQARDGERRGLRRAAMLQGAELEFTGRAKASEAIAAKAVEATAKLADIDRQRKELQANLDAARRENDAVRIQDITKKLADLELETKKANAEIAAGNADRDVDVQGKNIGNTIEVGKANADIAAGNADRVLGAGEKTADLTLRAQDQEEKQRIERGRFRIEVQKAIEDSAKGLLTEAGRQGALAVARRELDQAQQRIDNARNAQERADASADRAFWTTAITSLLSSVIPVPKIPAAKHGGAVTGRRLVEVGEAGDHELIIPIKGKLGADLAAALEIESKPFTAAGPKKTIETPDDLAEAVSATMRTFDAKRAPPPREREPEDDMLRAMSGGIIRSRKRREARY